MTEGYVSDRHIRAALKKDPHGLRVAASLGIDKNRVYKVAKSAKIDLTHNIKRVKAIDPAQRERILAAQKRGLLPKEIMDEARVSLGSVYKTLRQEDLTPNRPPEAPRPPRVPPEKAAKILADVASHLSGVKTAKRHHVRVNIVYAVVREAGKKLTGHHVLSPKKVEKILILRRIMERSYRQIAKEVGGCTHETVRKIVLTDQKQREEARKKKAERPKSASKPTPASRSLRLGA